MLTGDSGRGLFREGNGGGILMVSFVSQENLIREG